MKFIWEDIVFLVQEYRSSKESQDGTFRWVIWGDVVFLLQEYQSPKERMGPSRLGRVKGRTMVGGGTSGAMKCSGTLACSYKSTSHQRKEWDLVR